MADPAAIVAQPSLQVALRAVQAGQWQAAEDAARSSGPLAFDLVEWHRLRAGQGSFAAYADFATRRADWPGMELLRRKGEAHLDGASAQQILAYFSQHAASTGQGALALIRAQVALGRQAQAAQSAARAWRSLSLTSEDQENFLARYGDWISADHGGRMQAMLDRGDLTQARRMLDLVSPGTRAVAQARIALQSRADGVDALIAAVPEHMMGSYGLALDRTTWRWRESYEDGAADLLLEWSVSAEKLGDPALWADVRKRMARWDLRHDNPRRAYKLAAQHRMAAQGADYAELEWLAGFSALKLGAAPQALAHFDAVAAAVSTPISSARAAYWRGRALEAMGRMADAKAAWAQGAQYQTAYYGLLSAERLGLPLDPMITQPEPLRDWRAGSFTSDSVFQAALLLNAAGDRGLAERFLLHLEETLPADQISGLVDLALEWEDAHVALRLAKRAAENGDVLIAGYFPIPRFDLRNLGVPEELTLAIARRESEFDPVVSSHVGAQGLMQLMPGTAKMMASKLGVSYEPTKLGDPAYNARLGAAYLNGLREDFSNSPVLVAAGYNAGPGRSRRWMEEQGDPRSPTVDVIDWVELIPFDETRNYVMRVAESLPIYRARLGGATIRFTDELRGVEQP
ncbi:hypothetical protein BFP70_04650 [Thioclava sp. SK-1]|nr:hypothetical protein BFP70_04650 [Thioclava sp. SK-1]